MSAFDGPEYEVIYDWEAENEEDLCLIAGETITILQQHDHGWWYGVACREDGLVRGYFPKNYVKAKKIVVNAPRPPPRPGSLQTTSPKPSPVSSPITDSPDNVGKLTKQFSDNNNISNKTQSAIASPTATQPRSYSVRSLKAFDDLTEKGFAVELDEFTAEDNSKGDRIRVEAGMQVEISCSAMIWDGASSNTNEFSQGTLAFVAGEGQVTAGLEMAVMELAIGDRATITCSPSVAYGPAGSPPSVPPNSFIIYKIEILSATNTVTLANAVGPVQLLGSGVASVRQMKYSNNRDHRRDSRIILKSGNTESSAGKISADDNK
eukprot:gene8308-11240_t